MKVRELIEVLQRADGEITVLVEDTDAWVMNLGEVLTFAYNGKYVPGVNSGDQCLLIRQGEFGPCDYAGAQILWKHDAGGVGEMRRRGDGE